MKQAPATKQDIARLWREYKEARNADARDALISHYLDLVTYVAGRMAMNSPPQVEKDDLIGWGVLGLLDAVEKFDLGHNTTFETYASTRIRGAIIDEIRSLDWAPRSLRQKARQMEQAAAALKEKLEREPNEAELAAEMNLSEDELFELLTEVHGAYILSLDATLPDTNRPGEATLAEITGDTFTPSPEEEAIRKEAEHRLAQAIAKLPDNEKQVITLYYFDELTLKEVGAVLNLSESRICQIHRTVIKKLRKTLNVSS